MDLDAVMKKYDRESNTRVWTGKYAVALRWLTALFGMGLIWMNMFAKWDERFRRPLFVGLIILFVFAYYPLKKGSTKANHIPWYDVVLAVVGSFCYFFYCFNLETIVSVGTRIHKVFNVGGVPLLVVFGIIGILITTYVPILSTWFVK